MHILVYFNGNKYEVLICSYLFPERNSDFVLSFIII
jgi:hypothetical protein